MDFEHLEHVIRRSQQHSILARQDHRLKDVDDLRDVAHRDSVGVVVEDVEEQSGGNGVANRVLLVQRGDRSLMLQIR